MKFDIRKFDNFFLGFIPGILLPVLFAWAFVSRYYPSDDSFFEIIGQIYNKVLFGKILLLSAMPNMGLVFVFYKSDIHKTGAGIMLGGLPYMIASFYYL